MAGGLSVRAWLALALGLPGRALGVPAATVPVAAAGRLALGGAEGVPKVLGTVVVRGEGLAEREGRGVAERAGEALLLPLPPPSPPPAPPPPPLLAVLWLL